MSRSVISRSSKSKAYKFPSGGSGRRPKFTKAGSPTAERDIVELGTIQGQTPASKEEWFCAVVLWKYKIEFEYQVSIRGGRMIRGGQVLDFLVHMPFDQPVQVKGEYWHPGDADAEERWKDAVIEHIYGVPVISLWGGEMDTLEKAEATMKNKLNI